MKKPIRNRIVEHVQARAGDLLPHPLNYRLHPDQHRAALAASYEEVGFARSLLGYRLPDGRIQLIDGHLRRDLDPDMVVTVEVLDVGDDEARKLLLTLDSLSTLAESDQPILEQLQAATKADSPVLAQLWRTLAEAEETEPDDPPTDTVGTETVEEQFLILVKCRDEMEQVALLKRFESEGLTCKALLS
jgi:hypothetical protein